MTSRILLIDFDSFLGNFCCETALLSGDSLFCPDEQRKLDLENDHPNKTQDNLKLIAQF